MTNLIEQEGGVATPPDYLQDAQGYLIHRFSKIPKPQEPLVLEFTTDKALLHQYYLLRDQMFTRFIKGYSGDTGQNVYDKISEVLVARRGNLVIGGCRLTVRDGDESFLLPMESKEFKLKEHFSDLPLNRERHCVISKFAILEEHKERDLLYGLCKAAFDKTIAMGVHYGFACTRYEMARNWRRIASLIGIKNTRICEEVKIPESENFPGQRLYMILSDLSEFFNKDNKIVTIKPSERKLELVD